MKTTFRCFTRRVKTRIGKSPFPVVGPSPAICAAAAESPRRRSLECGDSYLFSPNGALSFQPRASPWVLSSLVPEALKGRPTTPPACRRWHALTGLAVISGPQPRAALRSALGWYGSAPLGLNTCGDKSPHSKIAGAPANRPRRSADFQVCCVAGFQTRGRSGHPQRLEMPYAPRPQRPLPIWKSAIQQVGKPALRGSAPGHGPRRSADFQVCCVAGFQTRGRSGHPQRLVQPHAPRTQQPLPIWKSAIQQVGKPALPGPFTDRPQKKGPAFQLHLTHPSPSVSIRVHPWLKSCL